jgi:hypothetical protein
VSLVNDSRRTPLTLRKGLYLPVKCHHDKKSPTISFGDTALQRLKGVDEHSSLQECLSSFGKGIAASRILGLDVPYHIVKFLRSRVGWPLEGPAHLWPSRKEKKFGTFEFGSAPETPNAILPPPTPCWVSPSTLMHHSGWGGALLTRGDLRIVGGRWSLDTSLDTYTSTPSLQECLSSFGKGIAASRVPRLDVP